MFMSQYGNQPPTLTDYTIHAKALIHIVRTVSTIPTRGPPKLTLLKLAKYYSKCKDKEITKLSDEIGMINYSNIPDFASIDESILVLSRDITERVLQHLLIEDFLSETYVTSSFNSFGADYIIEGRRAQELLRPQSRG